ncbi:MAG: diaminobutyrate acetyltransferase [Nesterenkonia sp.]|uniref:diaminobutyrate acetyltransferase n=1 Tax=Nesterenkonia marinintestina TaxID=2979865 RepID=UPI0021BDFC9D|nr:diaminobutyrate acetyltransferase [Nesterenkonia sp. GX14115]MDO5492447.1 diaminobutyrate acetyltransferase [Nesterenkonia sp.]
MSHTDPAAAPTDPTQNGSGETIEIRVPTVDDGAGMWRLARGTGVLDLNTPYAYILWARDFAATSVVALVDGQLAGFISGYVRPEDPRTLFVWQVGVDSDFRGRGLAKKMLFGLVDRTAASRLETTITSDNEASIALFTALARHHGAEITRSDLFGEEVFPSAEESGEAHAAEDLYTVEPLHAET